MSPDLEAALRSAAVRHYGDTHRRDALRVGVAYVDHEAGLVILADQAGVIARYRWARRSGGYVFTHPWEV